MEDVIVDSFKKKLLIIDDSAEYRTVLRLVYSSIYSVFEAVNGEEGVEMARKILPDIILCDVIMPQKDGFACFQSLRECADTCCIPVIILTSRDELDVVLKGWDLGVDDYMVKPCNLEILFARMQNLIKNREILKQHYLYTSSEKTPRDKSDPFISQVVSLIEEHMAEPDFNVNKLASFLCMSTSSLYRKVREGENISPIALIRLIRLRKAGELLKNGSLSIAEVAEKIGYNDLSSFRRHFAEYFGKVPSIYAKDN